MRQHSFGVRVLFFSSFPGCFQSQTAWVKNADAPLRIFGLTHRWEILQTVSVSRGCIFSATPVHDDAMTEIKSHGTPFKARRTARRRVIGILPPPPPVHSKNALLARRRRFPARFTRDGAGCFCFAARWGHRALPTQTLVKCCQCENIQFQYQFSIGNWQHWYWQHFHTGNIQQLKHSNTQKLKPFPLTNS